MTADDAAAARAALNALLATLDLEPLEDNLFRGARGNEGWQRVLRRPGAGAGADGGGAHRRSEPAGALAAWLLPAGRRSLAAHHLRRRAHPRRRQLHHAPRQGDPARSADLLDELLVPQGRGGLRPPIADARRAAPGGPAEPQGHHRPADRCAAREHAQLLEPRAADRHARGRRVALSHAARRRRPLQHIWIRANGRLPDDPPCTRRCLPMHPTSRCSTRR